MRVAHQLRCHKWKWNHARVAESRRSSSVPRRRAKLVDDLTGNFARGPQLVNRVVDISDYMDRKVWANVANVTQGPAGKTGERLRRKLAAQGKRLPLLGNDADTANRQYTKYFALSRDRARGAAHNLQWAEDFHYIGPVGSEWDKYIAENAVPL